MVELVARIRELLEARQLSPTQFADAIGIGRPVVSHILSGRNKPSLEVVQKIITAFPDLALPWLLNGEGAMLAAAPPAGPDAAPPPPPAPAPTARPPRNRAAASGKPTAAPEAPQSAADATPVPPPATTPQPAPPTESSIGAGPREPAAAAPAAAATPGPPLEALLSADKPIRRIVIFYRDGTFADYQPEA